MNATTSYTRLISVQLAYQRSKKRFALTSTDVPGLLLAGSDLPLLLKDVPAAIKLLYKLNYGMNIKVVEAPRNESQQPGWIPVSSTFVAFHQHQ
jgi:hypothetical protein